MPGITPGTFNSSRPVSDRLTPPLARPEAGFTLVELIVAIGLFALVSLIAIGALTSMLGAGQKSRELASVLNDLNFTLESMTREIRFGYDYRCGEYSDDDYPNCPEGKDKMTVTFRNQGDVTYEIDGDKIVRIDEDDHEYNITSEQVTITDLTFFVTGVAKDDDSDQSPSAIISVSGYAGSTETAGSRFTLQTSMSQRGTESAWKQYEDGTVSLSIEEVHNGNYSLKKSDNGDPHGGWKSLEGESIGRNFEMTGWLYQPADSETPRQNSLAISNNNFNGYGFSIGHNNSEIAIEKRSGGSASQLSDKNFTFNFTGVWFRFWFTGTDDGGGGIDLELTISPAGESNDNAETITIDDDSYSNFDRVMVQGGYPYYIDQLQVESDGNSVFQAGF